jgi:cell division protein FtsL
MSTRQTRTYHSDTLFDHAMSDWSNDQRRWAYVLMLLLAASVLSFVRLAQTGYVVRQIEAMEKAEVRLLDLKRQNNTLRLEIAEHQQWSRIRREARAMGFAEPHHVEYATAFTSAPPAPPSEGEMPGTELPSSPTLSESSPDWWHTLVNQFGAWIRGEQTDTGTAGQVQ